MGTETVSTPRSPWLVLIAMTGSLSMIMLDQTVVTVALPSMSRELPLSPTGQQWVVNAYVLAMASLVALGGKLGDRFGGVTTFRAGVTVFFVASALCGLVPHGGMGRAGDDRGPRPAGCRRRADDAGLRLDRDRRLRACPARSRDGCLHRDQPGVPRGRAAARRVPHPGVHLAPRLLAQRAGRTGRAGDGTDRPPGEHPECRCRHPGRLGRPAGDRDRRIRAGDPAGHRLVVDLPGDARPAGHRRRGHRSGS